jgi:hypothetical protein
VEGSGEHDDESSPSMNVSNDSERLSLPLRGARLISQTVAFGLLQRIDS